MTSDTSHEHVAELGAEWIDLKAKAVDMKKKAEAAFWKFQFARKRHGSTKESRLVRRTEKEKIAIEKKKNKH